MNKKHMAAIQSLERLAFQAGVGRTTTDSDDLRSCLSKLCSATSGQTIPTARITAQHLEDARNVAHLLVYGAMTIVAPKGKQKRESVDDDTARIAILKLCIDILRTNPEGPSRRPTAKEMVVSQRMPFVGSFTVWGDTASGQIEVIGPRDAAPWYLVAFAMWRLSTEVSPGVWRRCVEHECQTCNLPFYDRRWVRTGRERRFCSTKCYKRRTR